LNGKNEDKRKQESRKLKKQIATEQIDLLKPTILSYINNTFELQDFKYTNGDYSISHILNYSIDTIVTNYKTNVTTHFDKYVKKFVYCTLLKLLKEPTIPKHKKKNTNLDPRIGSDKDLKKMAGKITNHILYKIELDIDIPSNLDLEQLKTQCVPQTNDVRCIDIGKRPWVYLQRMVWMNQKFESETFQIINPSIRRLFSPFVLVSTFIPGFIRLDTSGIAQLLMDKKKIEEFKRIYEIKHSIKLNIKNKGDLLSSYEKITSKKNVSGFEKAQYATELWMFLCNFKNHKDVLNTKRKNGSTWVFDNNILTDGYSVSFQITKIENFNRDTKFNKPKNVVEKKEEKKEEKTEEFLKLEDASEWWSGIKDKNRYRILGADPGKRDILFITDGIQTLRYTKGMRDTDTHRKSLQRVSLEQRHKQKLQGSFDDVENPSIHDYEIKVLSLYSKKSCSSFTFREYWKRREEEKQQQTVYNKAFFRQAKFTVYCKTKSSERRFFNKIQSKFTKPSDTIRKILEPKLVGKDTRDITEKIIKSNATNERDKIVIGWGNWGRNPNLKNNAPTPGIGIRRRAEKVFKTITTPEHYTSKTCPCCRTKTLENPQVGTKHVSERHHLLRCTNDACKCRWWNRNVVGSFNILRNIIEGMQVTHQSRLPQVNGKQVNPSL
jgi:hypothetical protein